MSSYTLDNTHAAASDHLVALAQLLDGGTRRRIAELTGGSLAGMRCLEVGAGSGSIAGWLAEQVGPTGQVVALDLDPRHIAPHRQLVAVRGDITGPRPLPGPLRHSYDLIHARLVLLHLPGRRQVLRRLAGTLAPGGVLLVEDWAPRRQGWVQAAPTPEVARLYERVQAVAGGLFDATVDPQWATGMHQEMTAAGLASVSTEVSWSYWTAGSPGMRSAAAVITQLRPRLAAGGLAHYDLDEVLESMRHPGLIVRGHEMYVTSGRCS